MLKPDFPKKEMEREKWKVRKGRNEKIEKHELGINIIKNNIISDECDRWWTL